MKIKGHISIIRSLMAIQDHAKLQKATHGPEIRQEKVTFFVPFVTDIARFGTNFVREHFLLSMSHFLFHKHFLLLLSHFLLLLSRFFVTSVQFFVTFVTFFSHDPSIDRARTILNFDLCCKYFSKVPG